MKSMAGVCACSCKPRLWRADYVATSATNCSRVPHATVTLSLSPVFSHLATTAAAAPPTPGISSRHLMSSFKIRIVYSVRQQCMPDSHNYTHPFNGPLSGTTRVSRYQKGKTKLDFTEARDSEWQWHQLGHMQICTSLQTNNHASTPLLSFLQAGCPSCRPTNSVKALKAIFTQL